MANDDTAENAGTVTSSWRAQIRRRAWQERALTRATELANLLDYFMITNPSDDSLERQETGIRKNLDAAVQDICSYSKAFSRPTSAILERVTSQLDAIEVRVLRLAPERFMRSHYWSILSMVRQHLPQSDIRRSKIEGLQKVVETEALNEYQQDLLLQALTAGNLNARKEFIQLHRFRTMLLAIACTLATLAIAVGMWGFMDPTIWTICFSPAAAMGDYVCPTGSSPSPIDIIIVEFIGMLAAVISGASSLIRLNASTTSLDLSMLIVLIKLPSGALTAVMGLVLMQAEFVPAVSELDSPAQIFAFAALFGAAQQLITQTLDRQAKAILPDTTNAPTPIL